MIFILKTFFIFFSYGRKNLHISTLYIIKYFLSLFWQLLLKSQYLLTECDVTKAPFTLRELLAISDFSSAGVWSILSPSADTAVCVCLHSDTCLVKEPLWSYCLSMKCMDCSLEYSVWQNKHFTSLTPHLSLMRCSLELGSGAKDTRETRMDLWVLWKIKALYR